MEETHHDDFKWFGEGFDGFPKKLPEDVVEYIIFIIDSKLSDVQTRERLQAFQRALTALERKFLKEYIWQRDPIKLGLVREHGRWSLRGTTNYGDSVADEWLVTYLLRELSREFKDAWIRIYDTDGEFLLIEAANALPNWLNPEVAEHRVWINNHRLLILPLSQHENPRALLLQEALALITDSPAILKHFPKIEDEAFHRLKGYPAAIAENQHHVTLPLPRRVAHLLHRNPAYIASAVEAFYLRDPVSLRLLQPEKSQIPLLLPPVDFVQVGVRFTKVLYAQFLGQTWAPPGPYSSALETLLSASKTSTSRDRAELGIKVSAGLEMLLQNPINASKTSAREIKVLLSDLESEDDVLPTDNEIAMWPKRDDNEAWLNIDYTEFERELAGQAEGTSHGFGDRNAQENLRKMVQRFHAFMTDENAGLEGASGLESDPMDVDNDDDEREMDGHRGWDDPEDTNSGDDEDEDDDDGDAYADAEFKEYSDALLKFMSLSTVEKSALTADARSLALAEEASQDEDDEIQKLSDMMQAELFSHGALNINAGASAKTSEGITKDTFTRVDKGKGKVNAGNSFLKHKNEKVYEDDHESDDDDDEQLLDENYNLADNMLQSFKSQVGMAGPAGNLMGLMGIQFPPDADDEVKKT